LQDLRIIIIIYKYPESSTSGPYTETELKLAGQVGINERLLKQLLTA